MLFDTDNGTMIRIESFTPLALPLYAVLLVLLAVGAARLPGDRKPPMVAAALAWPGWACTPGGSRRRWSATTRSPPQGAERITVMNANLYEGRADAEEVVDAVRDNHVDILVLEEITPDLLAQMDAAGLAELLPDRVGEPDYMVAGTMILANRAADRPRPAAHDLPGVGGEVRRRSRSSACTRWRRSTRPAGVPTTPRSSGRPRPTTPT